MMKVVDFFTGARGVITELGGEEGTTIWMHPVDWDELNDAIGPPRRRRAIAAQRSQAVGDVPQSALPNPWDGGDVGSFQSCRVHTDVRIPVGTAEIRRGEDRREVPVGPFQPAQEPENGWPQPLYLNR